MLQPWTYDSKYGSNISLSALTPAIKEDIYQTQT